MKNQRYHTTVKHIGTQRYEITVLQDQDDMYTIAYRTALNDTVQYSENIEDYSLVSYLFDLKLTDLVGQ